MAYNLSPHSPMQPLSIGNVVSAGVRLYRSNFKLYLSLALQAYLWILVPIYGWAKYYAISAMISRHSFAELVDQPESEEMVRRQIEPRLWSFFMLAFRIGLLLMLVYFGMLIVAFGAVLMVAGISVALVGQTAAPIVSSLVIILAIIFFLLGFTWFFSRWILAEVPLAVEDLIKAGQSIDRSWDLTKKSVFRIQCIVAIAFLITLPLLAVTNYIPALFLVRIEEGTSLYWTVYSISLIASLIGGALVMPFWQALKAVLYYDLRTRREGFGLKLRDRDI